MKVAGCRATLCPLRTELITLDSAYSDTAVVSSCSRRSQYSVPTVRAVVNCNKWNKVFFVSSYSHTAPTALGIGQEIEEIRANVSIQRFEPSLFFRLFTFLTFLFFLERYYIYGDGALVAEMIKIWDGYCRDGQEICGNGIEICDVGWEWGVNFCPLVNL